MHSQACQVRADDITEQVQPVYGFSAPQIIIIPNYFAHLSSLWVLSREPLYLATYKHTDKHISSLQDFFHLIILALDLLLLLVPAGTLECSASFSRGSEIQRHKSLQCHAELGLMQLMVSLFPPQLRIVLVYSFCTAPGLSSILTTASYAVQEASMFKHSPGVDSLAVVCCSSLSSVRML